MQNITPYLFFNGNCREAMNFYKQCLGGDLKLFTYAEAPEQNEQTKQANKEDIMHSSLTGDNFSLMASDWRSNGATPSNKIHLNINCETKAEIEKLFKALSNQGEVVHPLSDTFWGAHFGMLKDKYGINWMLNFPLER